MEIVEVQFKAQRKEFFRNERDLYLKTGNYCIVQADRGEDMGVIISIAQVDAHAGPYRTIIQSRVAPSGAGLANWTVKPLAVFLATARSASQDVSTNAA